MMTFFVKPVDNFTSHKLGVSPISWDFLTSTSKPHMSHENLTLIWALLYGTANVLFDLLLAEHTNIPTDERFYRYRWKNSCLVRDYQRSIEAKKSPYQHLHL